MAEGSRGAVPETAAEVWCGVAVLEAGGEGGGVLRETESRKPEWCGGRGLPFNCGDLALQKPGHAHLYWSNLAYKAHSAGLLS